MASVGNIELEVQEIVGNIFKNNKNIKQELAKLDNNEIKRRKISISDSLMEIVETNPGYEKEVLEYMSKEAFSDSSSLISKGGIVDVSIIKTNITRVVEIAKAKIESTQKIEQVVKTNTYSEKPNMVNFYKELSQKPIEKIVDFYREKYKDIEGLTTEEKDNLAKIAAELTSSGDLEKAAEIVSSTDDPEKIQKEFFAEGKTLLEQDQEQNILKVNDNTETEEDRSEFARRALGQDYDNFYKNHNEEIIKLCKDNKKNIARMQEILISNNIINLDQNSDAILLFKENNMFAEMKQSDLTLLVEEALGQIYYKDQEIKGASIRDLTSKMKDYRNEIAKEYENNRKGRDEQHLEQKMKDYRNKETEYNDYRDRIPVEYNDLAFFEGRITESDEKETIEINDMEIFEALLNGNIKSEDLNDSGVKAMELEQQQEPDIEKSPPNDDRTVRTESIEEDIQTVEDLENAENLFPTEEYTPQQEGEIEIQGKVVRENEGGNQDIIMEENENQGKNLPAKITLWDKIKNTFRDNLSSGGANSMWPLSNRLRSIAVDLGDAFQGVFSNFTNANKKPDENVINQPMSVSDAVRQSNENILEEGENGKIIPTEKDINTPSQEPNQNPSPLQAENIDTVHIKETIDKAAREVINPVSPTQEKGTAENDDKEIDEK